jgi:hypothetical protein
LIVDLALIQHHQMIRGFVATGQGMMQGIEPLPTEGALQLMVGAAFQQQQTQGFAIKRIFRLQFTNRD